MTQPPITSMINQRGNMGEVKTYQGWLRLTSSGEGDDILFISSREDPLAEVLHDEISSKQVRVRYWYGDQEFTREQADERTVAQVMGAPDFRFGHAYSEVTGYLWTDEDINIGDHNLLAELKGAVGKYLILEIEIHA